MTTLNLPEPTIRRKERSITARYDTGLTKTEDYSGEVKKILLEFDVIYRKAGPNYLTGELVRTDFYSVQLNNATLTDSGIIGFVMGSGIGIERIEQPSNRFSRKKMEQIFEEWREKVEGLLSLDEDQLHLIDHIDQVRRSNIMPYWNGEKAGLA